MQGIPLDAIAVADAATHDGETFFPHVVRLFAQYPQVRPWIEKVLYDSACDSQALKKKFRDQLGIELKASLNPRRKKSVTENLPKGMKKLTPYGNLVCNADFEMD
jgi:methylphosphotriester-DNA--protein-cysteine methyltransferase